MYYFNAYGRADAIRMCLSHARVPFEDVRLNEEQFVAMKTAGEFPQGQLPVYIENEKKFCESMAILRLVGRQRGYYPPRFTEMQECDSIADHANEVLDKLVRLFYFQKRLDESGLEEYTEVIGDFVEFLKKKLSEGKEFLLGDKLSTADFMVCAVIFAHVFNQAHCGGETFYSRGQQIVSSSEAVSAYFTRMQTELKRFLSKRPNCAM